MHPPLWAWLIFCTSHRLRSTSNDTIFWIDFTPPVLIPGSEIKVGKAGVHCWDQLTGPFTADWNMHFHEPHTWLERFYWAIGNTSDLQKYVAKTYLGRALTQTAMLTFDEGDDVIVTVRPLHSTWRVSLVFP